MQQAVIAEYMSNDPSNATAWGEENGTSNHSPTHGGLLLFFSGSVVSVLDGKILEGLEKEAREAGKGLWAATQPVPPWEWWKMKE